MFSRWNGLESNGIIDIGFSNARANCLGGTDGWPVAVVPSGWCKSCGQVARRSDRPESVTGGPLKPQRRSLRFLDKVWLRYSARTQDPTVTASNMDLTEPLEKTADTDFLREMIGLRRNA